MLSFSKAKERSASSVAGGTQKVRILFVLIAAFTLQSLRLALDGRAAATAFTRGGDEPQSVASVQFDPRFVEIHHDIRTVDDYEKRQGPAPDQDDNTIPRSLPSNHIFMTSPFIPDEVLRRNFQMDLEDHEYHIYNNTAMANSVQKIDQILADEVNVTGAWEAWKTLRPWAFRADLWRYMILWQYGGIYLDSKMTLRANLSSWASLSETESVATCYDHLVSWHTSKHLSGNIPVYWNAVMSARERSPVLLEAIRLVIQNVENRTKYVEEAVGKVPGIITLGVTGPALLGYAAERVRRQSTNIAINPVRASCKHVRTKNAVYQTFGPMTNLRVMWKNAPLLSKDLAMHRRVREHGNSYHDLWMSDMLYCDSEKKPDEIDSACALFHAVQEK